MYRHDQWTLKRLRASSLSQAKKSQPFHMRGAHSGSLAGFGAAEARGGVTGGSGRFGEVGWRRRLPSLSRAVRAWLFRWTFNVFHTNDMTVLNSLDYFLGLHG